MKSLPFALIILLTTSSTWAACFDFQAKTLEPLKPAPSTYVDGKDEESKSADDGDLNWAKTSGLVKRPILEIYTLLLDPRTIRNGSDTKVEVTELPSEVFIKKIEENITVKPVFFLTLNWKEIWAYLVKDGTKEAPKSILVSYEKVQGTSHIRQLCGSILLQSLKPDQTGVYIFEELNADRRNAQDVLNGITGTLRTLRTLNAPPSMKAATSPSPNATATSTVKQYKN